MKITKKSLWVSVGLVVIISKMNLMAVCLPEAQRWEKMYEAAGAKLETEVSVQLDNRSRYRVWFQTSQVGMNRGGMSAPGHRPFGLNWIESGQSRRQSESQYATEGKGYIYYTLDKEAGATTDAPYETIEFDCANRTYNFPNFTVDIQATPNKIYYPSLHKAYLYYNYIITVTSKDYNPVVEEFR